MLACYKIGFVYDRSGVLRFSFIQRYKFEFYRIYLQLDFGYLRLAVHVYMSTVVPVGCVPPELRRYLY